VIRLETGGPVVGLFPQGCYKQDAMQPRDPEFYMILGEAWQAQSFLIG